MKNENNEIFEFNKILSEKLLELEDLEHEKSELINRFNNADAGEKISVKAEMDKSVKNYEKLLKEMKSLKNKVKILRAKNNI